MIGFIEGLQMIGHVIEGAVMLGLFGAGLSIAFVLVVGIACLPYVMMETFFGDNT